MSQDQNIGGQNAGGQGAGRDAAGEKGLTQRLRGMLGERFTRFVGSSLISTALDQVLAFLLFGWLRGVFVSADFLRIFTATLVARVCSVALNYAINMKRVFNDDKADHAKIEEAHAAQLAQRQAQHLGAGALHDDLLSGHDVVTVEVLLGIAQVCAHESPHGDGLPVA